MKFNNYLNEGKVYISILDKDQYEKSSDERIDKLISELNRYITPYSKNYKFGISDQLISPTDVEMKIDEKKKERIVRKWMASNEQLEDLQEK